MATGNGVSLLAHGIHYAVLAAGLAGLLYLLVPASRASEEHAPRDEHESRVRALRAELAQRAGGATTSQVSVLAEAPVEPQRTRTSAESVVWLPLAATGGVAAAVVHGAVCPEHLREKLVFGLFFAVLALAQLGWALAVSRAATRGLLVAGAVVNAAVVALWTITRVTGLPLGLLPEPEAIGRWDLAAVGAELLVVVSAVLLVRRLAELGRDVVRIAPFAQWHRAAQLLALGSALGLVALTIGGVQP